jgi:hypothetical protein
VGEGWSSAIVRATIDAKTPERSLRSLPQETGQTAGVSFVPARLRLVRRYFVASSSDISPPGSRAKRFALTSVGSNFLVGKQTRLCRPCWSGSEPVDGTVQVATVYDSCHQVVRICLVGEFAVGHAMLNISQTTPRGVSGHCLTSRFAASAPAPGMPAFWRRRCPIGWGCGWPL